MNDVLGSCMGVDWFWRPDMLTFIDICVFYYILVSGQLSFNFPPENKKIPSKPVLQRYFLVKSIDHSIFSRQQRNDPSSFLR